MSNSEELLLRSTYHNKRVDVSKMFIFWLGNCVIWPVESQLYSNFTLSSANPIPLGGLLYVYSSCCRQ